MVMANSSKGLLFAENFDVNLGCGLLNIWAYQFVDVGAICD